MKKILLVILLVLSVSSSSYGAVSQDMSVYVRQDVFDAKMEALFERLHGEIVSMKNEINGNIKALSERVDGNFATLSRRIDGLEKQNEQTNTFLYYLLVFFGAILVLPLFNRWWEYKKEQRNIHYVTLEDVKRLIATAIAEAQLGTRPQL